MNRREKRRGRRGEGRGARGDEIETKSPNEVQKG